MPLLDKKIPFTVDQYLQYKADFSRKSEISLRTAMQTTDPSKPISVIFNENFSDAREEELRETQKLLDATTQVIKSFELLHIDNLFYYFRHLSSNSDIYVYHDFYHFWSNTNPLEPGWEKDTPDCLVALGFSLYRWGFIREYKLLRSDHKIYSPSTVWELKARLHTRNKSQPDFVEVKSGEESLASLLRKVQDADTNFDEYAFCVEEEEKLKIKTEILQAMRTDREFIAYLLYSVKHEYDLDSVVGEICKDVKIDW